MHQHTTLAIGRGFAWFVLASAFVSVSAYAYLRLAFVELVYADDLSALAGIALWLLALPGLPLSVAVFVWALARRHAAFRTVVPLLATVAGVAASGLALPLMSGYGTFLFQLVVLGTCSLLDKVHPGIVDTIPWFCFVAAAGTNVIAHGLPATALQVLLMRRELLRGAVQVIWFLFYILALFLIFPATDGP